MHPQSFRLLAVGSAVVSVAMLAACSALAPVSSSPASSSTPASSPLRIVTSDFPNLSGMEALLEGTLTVDADGCVRVKTDGDPMTLVWPRGYTVGGDSASFEVVDAGNNVVMRSGAPFAIGGGGAGAVGDSWAEGDCATGTLWIVGDVS